MLPKDAPEFAGWECIEKLGEGGMCSVWRVRPASAADQPAGPGPERAIKVLTDTSDASVKRFADEARLLQRIDHPNVLRIHELHDEVRPPWIVMDLLAGRDLEETREEQGAMDPEQAARLFADVASGLAAVHALGVRHRDIKPANIMLGHDGVPRLIDFGIARETAKAHVTQKGFVVGTASYLPPEIFVEDDSHAIQDSVQADVYALGQALCEVLSGVPLHGRGGEGTSATLLVHIMKDKLDRPHLDPREWRSQVPEDLAAIVMAATAQEPGDRLQTARDLEQRLRAWLEKRMAGAAAPLTAVDPTALPPPPGTRERKLGTAPPGEPRSRTGTPAPAARRAAAGKAAAAGAASAAGIGLAAGGIALLTVVGMIILVVLAPSAPPADAAIASGISSATEEARMAIGWCAEPDTRGELVASFVVENRRARDVSTWTSGVSDAVAGCVTDRIEQIAFPAGEPVAVRLPVTFQ